jgi:cysteinyl-tRNA synthetase
MAEDRIAAKKAKDYAKADEIRDQIKALGYVLIDTKDGTKIEKA